MDFSLSAEIWEIISPILCAVLTAVISYVGLRIKTVYENYINTKEKEKIIQNTVQYVEQVFNQLHGEEKLNKAKETALNWLNEKGLPINEAELTILIESSVKALNKGLYGDNQEEN